jgi:hypothetical protein
MTESEYTEKRARAVMVNDTKYCPARIKAGTMN